MPLAHRSAHPRNPSARACHVAQISQIYDSEEVLPPTDVVFYRDAKGRVPALEGLDQLLADGKYKAWGKARLRIERLGLLGHEMRRPEADHLRDGVYELRITTGREHYRLLYFFHERAAVVSHLIKKERRVPDVEIARALEHLAEVAGDWDRHVTVGPTEDL